MGNDQSVPQLTPEELKNREIQKVDKDIRRKMGKNTTHNSRNSFFSDFSSENCNSRRKMHWQDKST